jgi:hypothetical protein
MDQARPRRLTGQVAALSRQGVAAQQFLQQHLALLNFLERRQATSAPISLGGVVVLAVIASSSSDISGPPTLRAGIPSANPSAYIGASTAVGTPVAIGLCIPFFIGLAQAIGG